MHPNLALHLHKKECGELIQQLHKCHQDNKLKKFFGGCNDLRRSLDRCLQKEYKENRTKNYLESLERKKRAEEKIERDSRPRI